MSLLPLSQALEIVAAAAAPLPSERVPLASAAGRFLAAPVLARGDLPAQDISMMDGYALRATEADGPLRVAFEVAAGDAPRAEPLGAREAARIFTGAPVPAGATCVVMQEHCERDGALVRVHATHPPREGQHVRRRGEEVRAGTEVLQVGTALGPAELSLLAACGELEPLVHQRPRVALLATGDELLPPGATPAPGKLTETNSLALAQLVREAGGEPVLLGIAGDRVEEIAGRLSAADAHLLVTTGGASVGDHDHAQESLERLGGELRFHTVAIRPGKPILFGTAPGGRLLFGLPGNPAAATLCFELFVRLALRKLCGDPRPARTSVRAVLREGSLARVPGMTFFPRGRLFAEGTRLAFSPGGQQSSMQIGSWAAVNAVACVEPGEGKLGPGDELDVLLLRAL